jgi:hypothetical protein
MEALRKDRLLCPPIYTEEKVELKVTVGLNVIITWRGIIRRMIMNGSKLPP